jgi:hypothetical protein
MTARLITIGAALGLALLAGPALADAIDGNWCHSDGRRFSIRGPEIVTPGGARTQGDYGRHSFSYAVPAAEPGAGKTVFMTLLDENTVHLRLGEAFAANPEIWIRCSPSVSSLELPAPS